MTTDIIEFFSGDPVVFESYSENESQPIRRVVDRAHYSFSNGFFSLVVESSNHVHEYDTVLYEDINTLEDGTLSFEFQGSERRIREIQDEDGVFIMQYEMPFPAQAMKEMIKVDGKDNKFASQSVQALADNESGEVKGFVYVIDNLGMFFRSNGEWDLPTPEMLEILDTSESIELTVQGAKKVIKDWDEGKKMAASELDEHRALR